MSVGSDLRRDWRDLSHCARVSCRVRVVGDVVVAADVTRARVVVVVVEQKCTELTCKWKSCYATFGRTQRQFTRSTYSNTDNNCTTSFD